MRYLLSAILGVALPNFCPTLPDWRAALLVAVVALAGCSWRRARPVLLMLALAAAGFAYAGWRGELRLAERLPVALEGEPLNFSATLRELPVVGEKQTRLLVEPDPEQGLPPRILLYDARQQHWPAGSRWQLTARLRRPHGTLNFHGFDAEAWLWSSGIGATGSVGKGRLAQGQAVDARAHLDRLRARLVQRLQRAAPGEGGQLLAALAVGAQGELAPQRWQQLSQTGLTHLISVSGLHIGLVALLVAGAVRTLLKWRPPRRMAPRLLVLWGGVVAALAYALLAGWSVPAQRTVLMLAVLALGWLGQWRLSALGAWAWALLLVLLFDPFAVLTPGLWLSFGLVAVLIGGGLGQRRPDPRWRQALLAQWRTGCASLLPLLYGFGSVPLISPLANALAIPLVSIVLTPLALLAAALPWPPLVQLAAWLAECFFWLLDVLAQVPALPLAVPPWPLLLLGLLGCAWLLMPRGVVGRWWGGVLLGLALCYRPPSPAEGALRVTLLDVGQGLAVLLQTRQHSLLYDTGAGDATRGLLPGLHGVGVTGLDMLLLSHHDSDHDGVASGLLDAMPVRQVLVGQPGSVPSRARGLCAAGQRWMWDRVSFTVLAPQQPAPAGETDNARSCVLQVRAGADSLLLTGDIGRREELQLLADYGAELASRLLVVPHHGSRGSSSAEWLAAVAPREAWFSSGYRNRYRHPHPLVWARYGELGSQRFNSAADGALRTTLGVADAMTVTARSERARYWRD